MQQPNYFSNARSSPLPYHRQLCNNAFNSHYRPPSENNENINFPSNVIQQNLKSSEGNNEQISENPNEIAENPGNNLTEFKLLEELGKGSYGIVYKVRSLRNKKEYVIKKIDLKILNTKHRKESLQEVQLLKKLSHPNMIKYHNSFLEKEILFIVMEYAEGGDLQKLIKAKKERKEHFTEQEIWGFTQELLSAINHLHSNSIIHRDIKTLNVFLSKTRQIKLGDLGVSKIVSQAGVFEGTRVGTPLYLAPELVQNRPYDYKIDVWALGCVLYHLTNLEPPFIGENLISLGYNIVNKSPKPLNVMYSQRLANFIFRLLEKNPAKRPKIYDLMREIEENNSGKIGRLERKSEKVEVSNEKEYLLLKKNILEEKGAKFRKIQEKYQQIIEVKEEKKEEEFEGLPEKEVNLRNFKRFESLSQMKNGKKLLDQGDKQEISEESENKLQRKISLQKEKEKSEAFDVIASPLKNNFIAEIKENNKSERKKEDSSQNLLKKDGEKEENKVDFQKKIQKNDQEEIKKIEKNDLDSNKEEWEQEKLFNPVNENNQRMSEKEKIRKIRKDMKKIKNIFELKNPKNINAFFFQEKDSQNLKVRPVSATFKPKVRTVENFYPQVKQSEKIKHQDPERPIIFSNFLQKPQKQQDSEYKPKKDQDMFSKPEKGPLLIRPKSALLPYNGQGKESNGLQEKLESMRRSKMVESNPLNYLEDYTETKGLKPQMKYDRNYIDNDETKRYRNGESLRESAEILPRAFPRPQTAIIRGENNKKKLTIYDLF